MMSKLIINSSAQAKSETAVCFFLLVKKLVLKVAHRNANFPQGKQTDLSVDSRNRVLF